MGKGLQILIAVTCVAVLAAIAYFGFMEYDARQQAERRTALVLQQAERSDCFRSVEDWIASRSTTAPNAEAYANTFRCRDAGIISEEELMTRLTARP